MPEELGSGPLARRLYLSRASSFGEWAEDATALGCPFVAAVVGHAAGIAGDELSLFARRLLRQGAAYVCTWGSECERVHDAFDEMLLERRNDQPLVMTTWHAEEPLECALDFAIWTALPASGFGDPVSTQYSWS